MNKILSAILLLDKPSGISSNQCLSRLRRALGIKRIGFIGTLDPLATGVLPVFCGKSTKLIPMFENRTKTYSVKACLGEDSPTLDLGSEITPHPIPKEVTEDSVKIALNNMLGEIEQIPPQFSAIKIAGKPMYEMARKGVDVELKPRKVTLLEIRDIRCSLPEVEFVVKCSKGTYIRSMVRDLAVALGTRGILHGLRRLEHGNEFHIQKATPLAEVEAIIAKGKIEELFLDAKELILSGYVFSIAEDQIGKLKFGGKVSVERFLTTPEKAEGKAVATDSQGNLLATGFLEFSRDSPVIFKPDKVLI